MPSRDKSSGDTSRDASELLAQAKFEAQQQLFASQQSAEAKAKAQQEANQDGLRALAERLDKPREARPIKDISSRWARAAVKSGEDGPFLRPASE